MKTRARKSNVVKEEVMPVSEVVLPQEDTVQVFPTENKKRFCSKKCLVLGLVLVAGLGFWWYKTNTWPVVAVADGRIITRYEVDKMLFRQGGALAVDEIVAQAGIQSELKRLGIKVDESKVEEQISQIRKSLGDAVTLESRLAERGWSMDELKGQIRVQLGVEAAVGDKVTVTDEEVAEYLEQVGAMMTGVDEASKSAEARKSLYNQKLQQQVSAWMEEIRAKMKVWYVNDSVKVPESL